jgi:hypothetical protein
MSVKDWYQRLKLKSFTRRFERERRQEKPLAEIMGEFVRSTSYDGPVEKTTRQDVTDFAKILASRVFDDGHNFSGGLLKELTKSSDWPFDLGQGHPNYEELLLIDFWAITYAFVSKPSVALKTELRDTFLQEFGEVVYSTLLASGFTPSEVRNFSELATVRFRTYYEEMAAWKQAMEEHRAYFGFERAITRNVFGFETNDLVVLGIVFTTFQSVLLAASVFLVSQRLHDRIAYGLLESEAP